jgi:hypothetical protein
VIVHLLEAGSRSVTHRVRGEALWLWQGGAPMLLRRGQHEHVFQPNRDHGQDP